MAVCSISIHPYLQEGLANNRALDIGCAVGRTTFELAREYDEVIGIDYSKAFISKCNELKKDGRADFSMITEGDLVERKVAVVNPSIVSVAHFVCVLVVSLHHPLPNSCCVQPVGHCTLLLNLSLLYLI